MPRDGSTYRAARRNTAREIRRLHNRMRDPSKSGAMPWWAAKQQAQMEAGYREPGKR